MKTSSLWKARYARVGHEVPLAASGVVPMFAGFTIFVDALYSLDNHGLRALHRADLSDAPDAVQKGLDEVHRRLRSDLDGEVFIDDSTAGPLVEGLFGPPDRLQVGGTSAQAAWTWARVGAPVLLSIRDQDQDQVDVLDPAILVATEGGAVPVGDLPAAASDGSGVRNHILQFTAGSRIGDHTIGRSSRIILRLKPKRLQYDDDFARYVTSHCQGAMGLVSGLLGLAPQEHENLRRIRDLAANCTARGSAVHLELSEVNAVDEALKVLDVFRSAVRSLGVGLDELFALTGSRTPEDGGRALAELMNLDAVYIHADRWAASVHREDPKTEADALVAGAVAASARAAAGTPQSAWTVSAGAEFDDDIPTDRDVGGGYRLTAVSTPYLRRPSSTIGLGDTFVGGLLLAHAVARSRSPSPGD